MEYMITVINTGCVSSYSMSQFEEAKQYMLNLAEQKIAFKFEIFK